MGLSPQQAKMLLQADEVLLANQIKNEKPLTKEQRERLEAIAAAGNTNNQTEAAETSKTPKFAKNQTELADILGVSRKTIQRHVKNPDAPKTKSDGRMMVGEWRNYLAAKDVIDADDLDTSALKAKQILLQNTILQQRIDRNDGLTVLKADVEQDTAAMIEKAKKELFSGPSALAPQVVGVSVPEAEKILKEWLH